jgi:hypothetical protein
MQVFSDQINEIPSHMLELQTDLMRTEKNIKQQGKSVIDRLKKGL